MNVQSCGHVLITVVIPMHFINLSILKYLVNKRLRIFGTYGFKNGHLKRVYMHIYFLNGKEE